MNLSENEVITVTYEDAGKIAIAIGDTVAITYSEFENRICPVKLAQDKSKLCPELAFLTRTAPRRIPRHHHCSWL